MSDDGDGRRWKCVSLLPLGTYWGVRSVPTTGNPTPLIPENILTKATTLAPRFTWGILCPCSVSDFGVEKTISIQGDSPAAISTKIQQLLDHAKSLPK